MEVDYGKRDAFAGERECLDAAFEFLMVYRDVQVPNQVVTFLTVV